MTRTMAGYYALLERALKKAGVDQPRWRVLMILGAKNPSNMSELAERAVIKNSTMTRLIQRMQRQGLVRERADARATTASRKFTSRRSASSAYAWCATIGGQIFRHTFGCDRRRCPGEGIRRDLQTTSSSNLSAEPPFAMDLPASLRGRLLLRNPPTYSEFFATATLR